MRLVLVTIASTSVHYNKKGVSNESTISEHSATSVRHCADVKWQQRRRFILRYSHQRNIIHQSIKAVSSHPTAQEIYAMVREEIPNISLGTIYRNLSQLLEHKLIREIQIEGISHYDGTLTDHHHFYCTNCSSIQE